MSERSKKSPGVATGDVLKWVATGYRLEGKLEAALAPLGLSLAKLNVLSHLSEAKRSLSLSEIADRLKCVRSNVTQLVDRLEAEGLVRRLSDPSDRRTVRAELTELGSEKQQEGAKALNQTGKELAALLSTADITALERLSTALE